MTDAELDARSRIYDQHKTAFATTSAAVVLDEKGKLVARIAVKHGASVTAYVHYLGCQMTRGFARGGGYDRTSAAIAAAAEKTKPAEYSDDPAARERFTFACIAGSDGAGWKNALLAAGYTVHEAI